MPQAAGEGTIRTVYFATTRGLDPATGLYGRDRSETIRFGRHDISIPPDRATGEIRFPRRLSKPDPSRDFVTVRAAAYDDSDGFRRDLSAALKARGRGDRAAVIYVHGFNNTFAEGLYRLAQLSHDLDVPGVAVHYSWPSRANPLGYVYDRDSAIFGRDGLEALIRQVTAAGADSILLVAHSMGSALTMETLRQMAIRDDRQALDRIEGVVLISPDIDVDVFRMQAKAMGKLPEPFVIFGSNRDRLLNLSARLTGEPERLGNLSDVGRLADLKVTYLDVAAYASGSGHFAVGDNPALISLLSGIGEVDAILDRERRQRVGLLPGVVLTVQNATEIILSPVGAVAEELSR